MTDSTVQIQLTQGYVAIVDECDGDLATFKWCAKTTKNDRIYVFHNLYLGGGRLFSKRKEEKLHRVILSRMLDRDILRSEEVDHINRNGLDNRRENLRLATKSQNLGNSTRRKDNKSGYKGVYWHNQSQKWRAKIKINRKQIHLGSFNSPEEAHKAYCIAADKYFGEFARFN